MGILKRDITALSNFEYDLIIVGGGIFGVCAAWDATLRGLSVALIEKGDFCAATSANHFKMVHGGIRYLQHGDLYRTRESSRERSALLRIAPHLVHPLPIVIPTYGHGLKGKEFLAAGLLAYDVITMGRNRAIQSERKIPRGRFLLRREVLDLFPGIEQKGLTGGAVFCDGQMYNPPRLGISFLRSAANEGAIAANYIIAEGFLRNGKNSRISGVQAKDLLTGELIEIQGRMVLNTSGPWANRFLESSLGVEIKPRPVFSRDLAFVVQRSNAHGNALAFTTKTQDSDTILDRGGRHLLAVPWRCHTLVGVWHKVFDGTPESIVVTKNDLEKFVEEVNEGYPGLNLSISDISMVNTGLTLFGDKDKQGKENMSFGKRSQLIDHTREHKIDGLITLIGVRATTARGMAEKAVDLVLNKLGRNLVKCQTESRPIFGGDMDSFIDFLEKTKKEQSHRLDHEQIQALIHNYGTRFHEVLRYTKNEPSLNDRIKGSTVSKAEVVHAVRVEMAQKLSDVVFRRTDLGTGGNPGNEAIQSCGKIMTKEMGWDQDRLRKEIEEVKSVFPAFQ